MIPVACIPDDNLMRVAASIGEAPKSSANVDPNPPNQGIEKKKTTLGQGGGPSNETARVTTPLSSAKPGGCLACESCNVAGQINDLAYTTCSGCGNLQVRKYRNGEKYSALACRSSVVKFSGIIDTGLAISAGS
jgi:hypothetical protein